MAYDRLKNYLDECFANSKGKTKIVYRVDCIHQLAFDSVSTLGLNSKTIKRINTSLSGMYKVKNLNYKTCLIEKVGD